MDKEYNEVIELGDGTKWFVLAETMFKEGLYKYVVGVNDEEEDFLDNFCVLRVYKTPEQTFYDYIKDTELLSELMPILVPESNKYLDNPEMIKDILGV